VVVVLVSSMWMRELRRRSAARRRLWIYLDSCAQRTLATLAAPAFASRLGLAAFRLRQVATTLRLPVRTHERTSRPVRHCRWPFV
jgi:hypothetical protein